VRETYSIPFYRHLFNLAIKLSDMGISVFGDLYGCHLVVPPLERNYGLRYWFSEVNVFLTLTVV